MKCISLNVSSFDIDLKICKNLYKMEQLLNMLDVIFVSV